jgi:hypothetical protein
VAVFPNAPSVRAIHSISINIRLYKYTVVWRYGKMVALGGPVESEEFYDRKEILDRLEKDIPQMHYMLTGPRRIGKTSILKELSRRGIEGLIPVYINVAHVVPTEPRFFLRELGRKVLEAVIRDEGLLNRMPEFISAKAGQISDFIRDNLRVKISGWLAVYFDESADLTEFIRQTFNTIEAFDRKLAITLDEITSLIRLRGAAPNPRDMEFMWALGQYIPEAKNARYIISGSQPGLVELLASRETGPFLGRFTLAEIGGLEEDGADELIRDKIKREIPEGYTTELKAWTGLWPIYLQAGCLITTNHPGAIKGVKDVKKDMFRILYGHFLYLESLLATDELRAMLGVSKYGTGSVEELYPRIGLRYDSLETAFRRLELKGFVKKVGPGTYQPIDFMFQEWLAQTREVVSPLSYQHVSD